MIPEALARYPSLEAFYDANDARRRSPEIDFGVMWRAANRSFPTWRISYVDLTGEVYAIEMGGSAGSVEVIGRLPLRPCEACTGTGGADGSPCHACGGSSFSRHGIDAAFASWADVCGDEGSLEWARRRAAGERIPVPAGPVAVDDEGGDSYGA